MTRILAIETIGHTGSLALAEDANLLTAQTLDRAQRMAQNLAPGIQHLLHKQGWQPRDIELIVVATGPGSFTGLRCGVVTAKTLAYATGAQVLGVHSLAAIAEQAPTECQEVETVLDAQRRQVFAAHFARDEAGIMQIRRGTSILNIGDWLESLTPGAVVSGPILEKLADQLPAHVTALPSDLWHPRAAAVAALGWRRYQTGARDDLWQLTPEYYRPSAAEEKLLRS